MQKIKVAIIGSGNIGVDLMVKISRLSKSLSLAAMAGIDPESDGLRRAAELGVAVTAGGIDGLVKLPTFKDVRIVFDATSAAAHTRHDGLLRQHGKQIIDLTPAAIGPYTIPWVNLDVNLREPNVNMVTCGGQATIPIVAAVSRVATVQYAEIVASISSRSAGPGTRANIDEFTETTSRAIVQIGGAERGKAIIVLNPAEPPLIMRDTIYCLCDAADTDAIAASVAEMVERVRVYVPGYRLKQPVQFEHVDGHGFYIAEMNRHFTGLKVIVFLEVAGAGDYLPAYAGNLDIMTSAALKTAERMVELRYQEMAV
jgi:acetaldehyde dehydrogenase